MHSVRDGLVRDVNNYEHQEQANAPGQKVQTAGGNMANTDSAVGSSWA